MRKVLLIYTGGTIGMVRDMDSDTLIPFDFDHVKTQVPELQLIDAELEGISFDRPIDSSNMSPGVWADLVGLIEENYAKFDGFVILHGSDTMAYTASALSFMIQGLTKPIVLTGSQLPIGVIRTDGKENLITAIEIASKYHNDMPVVPEVSVYFEYKLYRGNRSHKYNAEQFKAFRSSNYPLLAEAGISVLFNTAFIHQPHFRAKPRFYKAMNSNVFVVKLFPGIMPEMVERILDTPNLEALVLETYGSGNAPTDEWFVEMLAKAIKKGLIVLNVTQCGQGRVDQGRYETSAALKRVGVVGGADITTESAVTKLMFLLAHHNDRELVLADLSRPISGEITISATDG